MKLSQTEKMDRFMLHLKNSKKYSPKDAGMILGNSRDLIYGMTAVIRDCRVSSKFIELDISVPKNNLELLLDKLIPIGQTDHSRLIIEEKIEKENKTSDKELCPIYSGIAFLDRCLELEKLKSLKFYNVSYPLLMLPFISRASEMMSKKILVQFDKSSFLLNFDKSIFSKDIEKQAQSIAKVVNIEFMENKNSFSERNWKELYKLSEETFVDESDSLKQSAAGAGLTDND